LFFFIFSNFEIIFYAIEWEASPTLLKKKPERQKSRLKKTVTAT